MTRRRHRHAPTPPTPLLDEVRAWDAFTVAPLPRLVLYADGGCWPNPGPGTFGVVVKRDGVVVCRLKKRIGPATCNIAEWRGALAALDYALAAAGRETIELRMDSQLVVHQLNGRWGVKNEGLKPLVAEGHRRLSRLRDGGRDVRIRWVPREQNTEADALT